MKRIARLFCFMVLAVHGICQAEQAANGVLVGRAAPAFSTKAIVEGEIVDNFSLEDLRGQYVILFFYPLDFTFVCPTELHAFQEKLEAFKARNAQVIACSVDSIFSHLAWLNTPRSMGGIQGIEYPLLSDLDKSICSSFNVLNEEGIAYRGLFLIDREGIVRHQLINDLPLGRNVNEAVRMLDALITYEQYGDVCPANWRPGKKTLKPTAAGLREFLK